LSSFFLSFLSFLESLSYLGLGGGEGGVGGTGFLGGDGDLSAFFCFLSDCGFFDCSLDLSLSFLDSPSFSSFAGYSLPFYLEPFYWEPFY